MHQSLRLLTSRTGLYERKQRFSSLRSPCRFQKWGDLSPAATAPQPYHLPPAPFLLSRLIFLPLVQNRGWGKRQPAVGSRRPAETHAGGTFSLDPPFNMGRRKQHCPKRTNEGQPGTATEGKRANPAFLFFNLISLFFVIFCLSPPFCSPKHHLSKIRHFSPAHLTVRKKRGSLKRASR